MSLKFLLQYCSQREPFFSQILSQWAKISDESLPAPAGVYFEHNVVLKFNPKLLFSYNLDEQVVILMHEVMHILQSHHVRCQNRNQTAWNMATDLAVNSSLEFKMSDRLKEELILPHRLNLPSNKSAEWYYTSLQGKNVPANIFNHIEWYKEELVTPAIKLQINEASSVATDSSSPSKIATTIEWKKVIFKKLKTYCVPEKVYSFKKASRRFGVPPGKTKKKTTNKVIVVLDISSSISVEQLNEFTKQVAILALKVKVPVSVIECDNQVRRFYEFKDANFDSILPGGNTAFSPALDFITKLSCKENIGLVIYFTDGVTFEHSISKCRVPVTWVYPSSAFRRVEHSGDHLCLV